MKEERNAVPDPVHDPYGHPETVWIDEDGRASDMSRETVMSGDGCNPLARDEEADLAHSQDDLLFPGALTGIPGSLTGAVPSAYFPGAGTYPGNVI